MSTINLNKFNWPVNGVDGVVMDSKSMTVPDQSLTVKQILDRHVRGMAIPVNRTEAVYNQIDFQLETLDLTEMQDLKDAVSHQIEVLQDKLRSEASEGTEAKKATQQDNVRPQQEEDTETN